MTQWHRAKITHETITPDSSTQKSETSTRKAKTEERNLTKLNNLTKWFRLLLLYNE